MEAPEFFIIMTSILVPTLLIFYVLKRWFSLRERRLEVEAMNAAEKAAQYVSHSREVEARLAVIEQIVTGRRYFLIEALAMEVARSLEAKFPQIRRAKITLRKPNAPIAGVLDYVQVTVEHRVGE